MYRREFRSHNNRIRSRVHMNTMKRDEAYRSHRHMSDSLPASYVSIEHSLEVWRTIILDSSCLERSKLDDGSRWRNSQELIQFAWFNLSPDYTQSYDRRRVFAELLVLGVCSINSCDLNIQVGAARRGDRIVGCTVPVASPFSLKSLQFQADNNISVWCSVKSIAILSVSFRLDHRQSYVSI